LGIKDTDKVEIGGVSRTKNHQPCDSLKKVAKSESSLKKGNKNANGPKKEVGSRCAPILGNKNLAEQHKHEHSKSMNPVMEELNPKLKTIRNQLHNLTIRKKTAPKVRCHKAKATNTPQAAPMFPFLDKSNDKKAGKAAYPVLVGEVSILYKSSKLSCKQLTTVDLHGLSKDEAVERLDTSLAIWVDAVMRGEDPWVLGVDTICGGGGRILSDAVKEWIRDNPQVANRPKGCV